MGQRLADRRAARRQVEQGGPHELGRADQEPTAFPARAQADLSVEGPFKNSIGGRMSILSRLCLAVVLSLCASLVAAQSGAPESNAQEQQKRQVTQPGNNAPVWRDARSGEEHYTSIKGRETG